MRRQTGKGTARAKEAVRASPYLPRFQCAFGSSAAGRRCVCTNRRRLSGIETLPRGASQSAQCHLVVPTVADHPADQANRGAGPGDPRRLLGMLRRLWGGDSRSVRMGLRGPRIVMKTPPWGRPPACGGLSGRPDGLSITYCEFSTVRVRHARNETLRRRPFLDR
jgi:hypothetical protein